MSPAIQTYSDTEFAHLTAQLAKVTAERDRAREIAVALEQEVAGLRDGLTIDGAANTCRHDSASGIDTTSLTDPAKVWRCDHCGFAWRYNDDGTRGAA